MNLHESLQPMARHDDFVEGFVNKLIRENIINLA